MAFYFTIALFVFSLWYLRYSHKKFLKQNRPTAGKNIIAFGDSLTAGEGSSDGHNFVSVLSKRIGVPIINAGHGGDTTRDALERLQRDVLSREPKLVLVLLGGNDALRGIPQKETFKNLEEIIDRIHTKGSCVLLLGVRGGIFFDYFKRGFNRLAKEKKVFYVPDIFSFFLEPDLKSDYIHPNDNGYKVIANRIEPILRELVQEYF